MEQITIKSGDFSATIAPKVGGALMCWQKNENGQLIDIMRHALSTAVEQKQADQTAMFPLVPYSNRIRGGSFIYWGIRRNVPRNHPIVPDPLHGEGWQKEWSIEEQSDSKLVICFDHDGKSGFPFAYHAQQTFEIINNTLNVVLKLTNKGGLPMPCGLGWHPFFPKDNDTIVKFKNKTLWAHEASAPRERPIKVSPEWCFDKGLEISTLELDTCFGGFDGKAEIEWPSRKRKVNLTALSDFGHVVVWSPKGENFFCVEPVTNANDAFNLASRGIAGTGIKTLDPEESLRENLTLEFSNL
ncbi:MAG: aldose 1-epimerase [Alphaproteobacteria bacterium]|nr:aldose 1-epimerase [Alphaproteobacteria bacterium]